MMTRTIPSVPEDVTGRLEAIWADAYRAALASVTPERDQLRVDVDSLRIEVDGLTAEVETVEAERDASHCPGRRLRTTTQRGQG